VPPDVFDAYFWVDDVVAIYTQVVARGAQLLHGPVNQGYGLREFRVQDPEGYILAFGRNPQRDSQPRRRALRSLVPRTHVTGPSWRAPAATERIGWSPSTKE